MKRIDLKHATFKQLKQIFARTKRTYQKYVGQEIRTSRGWTTVPAAPTIDKTASTQKQMAEMRKAINDMRVTYRIKIPGTASTVNRAKNISRWENFTEELMMECYDSINDRAYSDSSYRFLMKNYNEVSSDLAGLSDNAAARGGALIDKNFRQSAQFRTLIEKAIFDSDSAEGHERREQNYARFREMISILEKVSMKLAKAFANLLGLIEDSGEEIRDKEEEVNG